MKNNKQKQMLLRDRYLDSLYNGSRSSTLNNSASLRANTTKAEQLLWSKIRNRQLKGKKFRRQHPVIRFVLDFYCHECKLDVELDGHHHKLKKQKEYDKERAELLKEFGITTLRFWNHEVINETQKVLDKISEYLR
jgi:very-short-patch-repair endonuclease